MTLSIPPGYAHVVHSLKLATDPEPMAVTYGVALDAAADTEGEVNTLVQALHDAFAAEMVPQMSTQYSLIQTECQYLFTADTLGDPHRIAVGTGTYAGASTDAPCVQNTAILIHKRTATAGHRGRGRIYLPSALEASVDANGTLGGSYRTATQSNCDDWYAAANAVTNVFDLVVLHSWKPATETEAGLPIPYPITSLVVDPIVATQRRRLRK